jgi:hypothetical protein
MCFSDDSLRTYLTILKWSNHVVVKVAVILDSSRAFPKEHLKKQLTAVYVTGTYTIVSGLNFRCSFGKAREESKITATLVLVSKLVTTT